MKLQTTNSTFTVTLHFCVLHISADIADLITHTETFMQLMTSAENVMSLNVSVSLWMQPRYLCMQ